MSQAAMLCPKCQGEMVQGGVVTPFGIRFLPPIQWVGKGWLTFNFWWGYVLHKGKSAIPIGTFRCQSCGFLESYARDEFAVK